MASVRPCGSEADHPMLRSKVPMSARIVRAVVALVVLGAGLGSAAWLAGTRPEPVRSEHGEGLPRVAVFSATRIPVARQWRGFGVADALVRADVPARVTATVAAIPPHIQAGVRVRKDDVLAELDDADFTREAEIARQRIAELDAQLDLLTVEQARLEERVAIEQENLALASAERQRVERLFESKVASQQDYDAVRRTELIARAALNVTTETFERLRPRRQGLEAQKQAQYAALQLAELNAQRCRIVSPIDGVLQSVAVKLGENVAAGQRVARVIDLSRVEVPVQLPAAALHDMAIGDAVRLVAANGTGRTWAATLMRLAPESDPQARTLTAFVEVDQRDAAEGFGAAGSGTLLTPGMFVEAVVTSGRVEQRFVVPRRAVRAGRVMVVEGGTLHTRPVRVEFVLEGTLTQLPLPADDQWAVLDNALREGETVLVTASATLLDGARVEAVAVSTTEVASRPDPAQAKEPAP
jgi:HlyD family secretion protein